MTGRSSTPVWMTSVIAMGERVLLRHPTARDRAEYVRLRERSETFLQPWEPYTPEGEPYEHEDTFSRLLDSADTGVSQRFLVRLIESGEIVGQVSLNQIFRGPFQNCILGYWIGEAHARRGLMTEALRLALGHAFGPMGLHRCEANIIPENTASIRLVRGLGFRFEGLALRYLQIAGRWRDHEHWAMTVEDWKDRKSPAARAPRARR